MIAIDSGDHSIGFDHHDRSHQSRQCLLSPARAIPFAQDVKLRAGAIFFVSQTQSQLHVMRAQVSLRHSLRRMFADAIFVDLHCNVPSFTSVFTAISSKHAETISAEVRLYGAVSLSVSLLKRRMVKIKV
jgi:hypothetical protein